MTVTTFGGGGSGGGISLPSFTDNNNKFLYTDGKNISWKSSGFTLIQNQSGNFSSMTFSNIPQSYNHLKIIGHLDIGNGQTLSFTTNGFSSNYSGYLYHNGGTTWSGGGSNTHYLVPYIYSGGSSFELTIPNYKNSNNKAWQCMSASVGTSYSFGLSGGNFSGGAINTISLSGSNSGSWNVSLYGLD